MRIKMIIMCFILCFISSWAISQEVKLGALQDTTGATSDVGKDEALGVREAAQYYNDKGGINGKKISLRTRTRAKEGGDATSLDGGRKFYQGAVFILILTL